KASSSPSDSSTITVLAWLIMRSLRQQREIAALRQTLDSRPAVAIDAPSAAAVFAPQVEPANAPAFVPELSTAGRTGPDTLPSAPGFVAAETTAPPRPLRPSRRLPVDMLAPIKRWLFGGNTIVKAGIGILFVGLAFLAKYASEHAHLPVEVRLAAIGGAAVALLAFGWSLRTRRPDYAQVLQGGAIAVLYLTLFAAFRFYGVLSATPAFVLMVAVAGLAAALAVLQDARALALIGALGGFATPLIVSTGSDNDVALFAYYLVLDAGIAAVAWSKTWRSLNLVGFVATFVVATAWGVLKYQPDDLATSEAFLVAFFLLFVVILVLPARRAALTPDAPSTRHATWVNSTLLFGLPTVVFALQYGLVRGIPFATAFSAAVLGGFYVALAFGMKKRPELGLTFDASLAIAAIFLTLVIPFALDERSTAGAWALEAAGLIWIGLRQQRRLPRAFGYLLFAVAGLAMLFAHDLHGAPTELLNAYLFNGLMAAAAALAAAFFVRRQVASGGVLRAGEETAEPLLIGLGTLWLASTAMLQIVTFVAEPFQLAAVIVAASAVAAVYAALSARFAWPQIALPALAHGPILFLAAAVDAALLANPLLGGGSWAWPLAFAAHAVVLRLAAPRWPQALAHLVHALGAITLALVGALLGRALTAGWGDADSAWPWLGWLIVPAALLLALPRAAIARLWPVRAVPAAYRVTAAAVLAAGLWLWTLVANVASDGAAAPLPHLPFLNPLDIGIATALAATFLWLRGADRVERWSLALGAGAGFVWLNAVLVRAFHHYGGVPWRVDAWLGSLAVQTGITLLWTTIALVAMWLGARRGWRTPWVGGATLLGAVVFKMLLVDLSGSGSVTRIVSFVGVGVLMLVIGYVAPLPSREARHAAA
ncbi:MAG: DUF2339 domain-containing protein, partial [Caldimonas sp.]